MSRVSALALAGAWVVVIVSVGWRTRPRARAGTRAPALLSARRRRRREAAVIAALPEVVDLFTLAVGAGRNVTLALEVVSARAPSSWRAALQSVATAVGHGERVGDALSRLVVSIGEPARPLATCLASSARYGTALLPSLERLAAESRAERRRRADIAARRLPVTLLFPLVLCILPAFALLTLAPAIAGALHTLRL